MSETDDFLYLARQQLERVEQLSAQVGLQFVQLMSTPLGVGIAMQYPESQFIVLSVLGGGSEHNLYITSGVIRDIDQDRLAILNGCNRLVSDNPSFPCYLHDAEIGWDVLLQVGYPIQLLEDVPQFFSSVCNQLPARSEEASTEFAGLGGAPFRWNEEEIQRLLICSLA